MEVKNLKKSPKPAATQHSSLQHGIATIKNTAKVAPKKPGVYKMISKSCDILYVGKAKNLPKRIISYSSLDNMPNRLRRMVAQIDSIEYEVTKTEAEALLLEASLIRNLKPRFNIALRDDKSFPYIFIDSNHQYPRITKFRGTPKNKTSYWGPFASVGSVNETIVEIQKIFNIRPCSNSYFASRSRPCLEYQIHRCSAPCVGKISEADYNQSIAQAKRFLNGKSNVIHNVLQKQMWKYSEAQEYEKAAKIRNKINALNQIQNKNVFNNTSISYADVIGIIRKNNAVCIHVLMIRNSQSFGSKTYYPSNVEDVELDEILHNFIGQFYQSRQPAAEIIMNIVPSEYQLLTDAISKLHNKVEFTIHVPRATMRDKVDILEFVLENASQALLRKVSSSKNLAYKLQKVAEIFELQHKLKRVEIYDNSHNFGKYAIGAYVVLTEDGFKRSEYRKYNIKLNQPKSGGDDYSMLTETLSRRIKRLNSDNYPDLILIDGGKGHLSVALAVLQEYGIIDIPIVAISKGVNRNAGREFFHIDGRKSFQLPVGDESLKFLQMMRDEAHNCAISQHRTKHRKSITASQVDDIPGVGRSRKFKLLQHFGSYKKVEEASAEDLARVDGISKNLAQKIYNHLQLKRDI